MKFISSLLVLFLVISVSPSYSQNNVADTVTIDSDVFQKVETEASYPDGINGWRKFLEKNLNANTPVDNGAPMGRYQVIVQFVVDINGEVSDVKPLTKYGWGMENEVVRLIKRSGKWNPAIQNGRPVKAYRKQPVTFQVTQEGLSIHSQTPFVLFTGVDNEISVKAARVKNDDITLTSTSGTIIPKGDGKFMVKVAKPGKAIITAYNKRNKEIGAAYFEVKEQNE
jgi:hypothetical protein